jgi:aminomethyltransferase
MISNCGDYLLLVVNAACKAADIEHLRQHLPAHIKLEYLGDRALLALQGPAARAVMGRLASDVEGLTFMHAASMVVAGIDCFVACSGYTGEDGFELSVAAEQAELLAEALLAEAEVEAVGLGARDTLRLEAGLCLYGHDLNGSITPVEANLRWAISRARRPGGERAGGYPGADVVAQQLAEGVERQRLLLQPTGRAPVREGADVVNEAGEPVGMICSGGFGPSVGGPVAMGYVDTPYCNGEHSLYALVRNKRLPLQLVKGSFVPQRYFRG